MRDHVASFHECQKLSNKKRSFRTRKAQELIKNDMEFTDGPKPTEDDKDAPEPDSPSLIENNVMDFYLYYCDDVFNSFSELNRHKFSKHPPPDLLMVRRYTCKKTSPARTFLIGVQVNKPLDLSCAQWAK